MSHYCRLFLITIKLFSHINNLKHNCQHLEDIRVTIEPLPGMSFTLEFVFSPNEYFDNDVLTKSYIMKCEPEIDTPFTFDGPEIYKSTGCEIRWKEGKNLTQQLVKQKNPENGQIISKSIPIVSFKLNFSYRPTENYKLRDFFQLFQSTRIASR